MAIPLKYNTASQEIPLGYFLDSTNGDSEETSLTIANTDIKLWKHGATTLANKNSGGATHISNGIYYCTLDATDTNTYGSLRVYVHVSGALATMVECEVMNTQVWDSFYGSDYQQVDTVQIEGSDATDQINSACDTALTDYDAPTKAELDSGFAALNDLTAAEVNAEVDTALADYDGPTNAEMEARTLVASEYFDPATDTVANVTLVATTTTNTDMVSEPPTVGDIADAVWDEAKSGHISGGSFGEEVQSHSLSTEISALNDISTAEVNAEVDTALADYDAPTKTEMDSGFAALNDPSSADVADAVWDEAKSGHVSGGSFGEEVQAHSLSTEISALNDISTAEVNAEVDTALADYDAPTKAELDSGFAALNDPSSADIADAVWDEAKAGHTTTDTFGYIVGNLGTANDVADAIWDEAKAGHVGAGSFGEEVQAHSLSTEISALNDPSAATIADAVWDENLAAHDTEDSVGNVLNDLTEEDTDVYRFNANALSEAPSGGATAGEIADAVWDENLAAHDTEDSVGNVLNDLTEEDTDVYRFTSNALSEAPTGGGTSAEIADAVWDEAKSGHVAVGSFGEEVQAHSLSTEISALNDFDPTSDTVANVTLVATTTDVTNEVSADVTKISGDTAAADNLEATYDGTGYENGVAPAQQQQISGLAIGSSAISTVATSVTITTGTPTGTYDNTHARDSIYHQIADVAGTTDLYYEFDVSGNGVPVSVSFVGYVNGNNDSMKVYAYDWGATAWDQIGNIIGKSGAVDDEESFSMYNTHVGTGSDIGKVRIRFQNTGLTSSNLAIDQLYVSYAIVVQSVGYADGAIWVDTNDGSAGTEPFVNGTADNPVLTLADALTLSSTLKIKQFHFISESSVTLTSAFEEYTVYGTGYTVNLNGQSIDKTTFHNGLISGIGSGAEVYMDSCLLSSTTLPLGWYFRCGFLGTTTLLAGNYTFNGCLPGSASVASIVDYTTNGNTTIAFYGFKGDLDIRNMGQSGTDVFKASLCGEITFNANCIGGTASICGNASVTNNGSVTISDDARIDIYQINTQADLALSDYDGPTRAEATADKDEIITEVNANETKIDALNDISTADVATELATYDSPTKAEMDAGFAALNDISTADVATELATYDSPTKAEMDAGFAALNDPTADTIATAVVGKTLSEPADLTDKTFGGMIYHLFARFFHKNTQTSTEQKTYKSDDTLLATRTTSDDATTQTIEKAI